MCIFKIEELADCLLFIGQVGDRENLTYWSQERKNGDFFNSLQFENDDFYPQKSQIVKVVYPLWCTYAIELF